MQNEQGKNIPNFIARELTVQANRNAATDLFLTLQDFKRRRISLKSFTHMWQELLAEELQIIQHALHMNQCTITTTTVWEAQDKRKPDEII